MFLANESHLKEVMLILFVSEELELLRKNNSVLCFVFLMNKWYLKNNASIFCFIWMNDT